MRLLFFITFLTAILFSEVVTHVVSWDSGYSSDYEGPVDESNENESSEDSKEDNAEEDKLFEVSTLSATVVSSTIVIQPRSYRTFSSQSLREIHSPPPDFV